MHARDLLSFFRQPARTAAIFAIGLGCLWGCDSRDSDKPFNPPIETKIRSVVTDLIVRSVGPDHLFITWTAPPPQMGPVPQGQVLSCEIRFFTDSLTSYNWYKGTLCSTSPLLADSGVSQSYTITGVLAGETTFVAISITDGYGIYGPVSANVKAVIPSFLAEPVSFDFAGTGITAADIDRDGDTDLVIRNSNLYASNLITLTNDGKGNFTEREALTIPGTPQLAHTADFNNDGHPDIAILCPGRVYTLANDGAGYFSVLDSQSLYITAGGMHVGDVNGDGYDDIVAASYMIGGKGMPSYGLQAVYFCGDSGKFVGVDTVSMDGYNAGIYLFDADGDHDLDIAFLHNSVWLYYNDGTGLSWTPYSGTELSFTTTGLASGDLNNDGRVDLVATPMYQDRSLITAIRNEDGTYTPTYYYTDAGGNGYVGLGDLSGDGFLDVVRADSAITFQLNDHSGGFPGAARYLTEVGPYSISLAVADFDGDGHPDVAALQNYGRLYILLSSL